MALQAAIALTAACLAETIVCVPFWQLKLALVKPRKHEQQNFKSKRTKQATTICMAAHFCMCAVMYFSQRLSAHSHSLFLSLARSDGYAITIYTYSWCCCLL